MKDIEILRKELEKNFLDKKIYVELEGNITYRLTIENVKFLLNKVYLILSDNKENQLSICFDEVEQIDTKESYIEIYFNYEQKIRIYAEWWKRTIYKK